MPKGGSKPGERRGGRKAGTPNKSTAEIKSIAQQWGAPAIRKLAELAGLTEGNPAESEAARIQAMSIILDRGYGKAAQPHTGEGGEGPVQIQELLSSIDGKTRGIPTSR
jgi:hypothetical protein